MDLMHLLKDPPIQIILTVFSSSLIYTIRSYSMLGKELKKIKYIDCSV